MYRIFFRYVRERGYILAIFLFVMVLFPVREVFSFQQSFTSYEQAIPGAKVSISMSPVAGGVFDMGIENTTKVKVDSFWMGTYEITWDQYNLFVREAISDVKAEISREAEQLGIMVDAISLPTPPYVDMSFGMGRENRPAISMTHYAAIMFAKWLSGLTGTFYRLPTEAEWEYACRAGSAYKYHQGKGASDLDEYEWYAANSSGSYNQVGVKKPNAFGLYDMQGNVAEWTMDQYVEDYHQKLHDQLEENEKKIADNPWFRPETLYPRAVRGGSWMEEAGQVHCLRRRGSEARWKMLDPQLPKSRWWHTNARFLGFRLVRPKNPPGKKEIEQYWLEAIDDY